jgi:glyoxylase-like metal-dependent hydrolase (beta-lactamase superfamily II)
MNSTLQIFTLDLNFQNCRKAIASYLIPSMGGLILIESGPGSTQAQLEKNLQELGYDLEEVNHVFLTHIHLDHAGAAGWLAERTGANIYVHPRGAPHMLDPTRLLASATRIYQERMDELWGKFLPVPEEQLVILNDGDEVMVGEYALKALDTPGHANHHLAYILDEVCFSGDVGGVRIQTGEKRSIRLPMPPPEFHPPRWRESISKLKKERISTIIPTHFGSFTDVDWHFSELLVELDLIEKWMDAIMPQGLEIEELRAAFLDRVKERENDLGIIGSAADALEKANPSGMSADGIKRYWEKYVQSA